MLVQTILLVKLQMNSFLKTFIAKHLPNCRIVLSQPIIRNDNTKAKETICYLVNKLDLLNIEMVDNRNIELKQLGRRGLHLNKWGTSKLAMNYISFIRGFQQPTLEYSKNVHFNCSNSIENTANDLHDCVNVEKST